MAGQMVLVHPIEVRILAGEQMNENKELTNRLIGKDFGKPKGTPKYYKSLLTGNTFIFEEYSNHGYGGIKHGLKDLPHDQYPYTILY
jgi:hypothetical protein